MESCNLSFKTSRKGLNCTVEEEAESDQLTEFNSMAVLRVLTHRSGIIVASRRPSNFAVLVRGRQLHRESTSTGICGSSGSSPANARLFLATTNLLELKLSQWRLVGAKVGRRTATSKFNFSSRAAAAAEWNDDCSPYETLGE